MMGSVVDWHEQARAVTRSCQLFLPDLVGVYAHGSAALGGMTEASDLDILVITRSGEGSAEIGRSLLSTGGRPRALELSVVTEAAAENPQHPWPFVVHVNSGDGRFQVGSTNGDPDLLAHYAVTRAAGVTLIGPEPKKIIGEVDPDQLLCYLRSELRWGLDHGDERYAVLNACRASVYKVTGKLVSKFDGAKWWANTHGAHKVVTRACEAQAAGIDLGPSTSDARSFVNARIAELHPIR